MGNVCVYPRKPRPRLSTKSRGLTSSPAGPKVHKLSSTPSHSLHRIRVFHSIRQFIDRSINQRSIPVYTTSSLLLFVRLPIVEFIRRATRSVHATWGTWDLPTQTYLVLFLFCSSNITKRKLIPFVVFCVF